MTLKISFSKWKLLFRQQSLRIPIRLEIVTNVEATLTLSATTTEVLIHACVLITDSRQIGAYYMHAMILSTCCAYKTPYNSCKVTLDVVSTRGDRHE